MPRVLKSLADASKHFQRAEDKREKILKDSRDVISNCSKAIVSVHTGDPKSAELLIFKAREGLKNLRDISKGEMDRYLTSPETEFVEAETIYRLALGRQIPGMEDLNVQPESYVLGLLDAVGEARRRLYDSVRIGKLDEAERLFETMESFYVLIKPLAIFDHVVPGLRRKLDVARGILEDARSLLTEESRRTKLLKTMRSLEEKLNDRK